MERENLSGAAKDSNLGENKMSIFYLRMFDNFTFKKQKKSKRLGKTEQFSIALTVNCKVKKNKIIKTNIREIANGFHTPSIRLSNTLT